MRSLRSSHFPHPSWLFYLTEIFKELTESVCLAVWYRVWISMRIWVLFLGKAMWQVWKKVGLDFFFFLSLPSWCKTHDMEQKQQYERAEMEVRCKTTSVLMILFFRWAAVQMLYSLSTRYTEPAPCMNIPKQISACVSEVPVSLHLFMYAWMPSDVFLGWDALSPAVKRELVHPFKEISVGDFQHLTDFLPRFLCEGR